MKTNGDITINDIIKTKESHTTLNQYNIRGIADKIREFFEDPKLEFSMEDQFETVKIHHALVKPEYNRIKLSVTSAANLTKYYFINIDDFVWIDNSKLFITTIDNHQLIIFKKEQIDVIDNAESVNDKLDRIFSMVKELDDNRKGCIAEILYNSIQLTSTND